MNTEQQFISALAEIFPKPSELLVGIGDDAAVVTQLKQNLVAAADMAVEDVHFKRNWSSNFQIGAKIATANIADIFAMGAEPKYLLVSVALPKGTKIDDVKELALGIKSVSDRFATQVIGGDISSSEKLVVSISALGQVSEPILRSGAKTGDKVVITGLPGWSALGLSILENSVPNSTNSNQSGPVLAHLNPYLVSPAKLFSYLNSLTDISDGLVADVSNIAKSSNVEIVLQSSLISGLPGFSEFSELAKLYGQAGLDLILNGGEDHLFVGTISENNYERLKKEKVSESVFVIGQVMEKTSDQINQINQINPSGVKLDEKVLKSLGFKHF